MKKVIVIVGAWSLMAYSAHAQKSSRAITGMIVSETDRRPIEGVAVMVKGTRNISGSQEDGIYYLSISPSDSILVVNCNGYEAQEIRVNHEKEYNVALRKKYIDRVKNKSAK